MKNKTLVYRHSGHRILHETVPDRFTTTWRPSIFSWVPRWRPKKYLLYAVFHLTKIFKNRGYSAVFVGDEKGVCASMMVVPSHYKWPFMAKDDLQFIYGVTFPWARGRGWGTLMIKEGLKLVSDERRMIWALISEENTASRKMVEKNGFKLVGEATRRGFFMPILRISKKYDAFSEPSA